MTTELEQLTGEQLLLKAERVTTLQETYLSYCEAIERSLQLYPDATAVVVYSCHLMDSSSFGRTFVLLVGPSNTLTAVPERGKRAPVVPVEYHGGVAGQCFYPDGWCMRDSLQEAIMRRKAFPEVVVAVKPSKQKRAKRSG